ncbi:hypothetical protein VVR12_03340 [Rothia sp. LK2588]|uniref:hypothetical protein n=1 Tax=Rothia sp. LK2588 TaxID=3114369 RepID=UPI0034CD6E44
MATSDRVELAQAYVSLIPTMRGITRGVERELGGVYVPAARKVGQDMGREMGTGIGAGITAPATRSTGVTFKNLGAEITSNFAQKLDLGGVVKVQTQKVTDQAKIMTGAFVSGFRDAQAAQSTFSGYLGTAGGAVRTYADIMARPGQNFVSGFRDAQAANSSFTGYLGTLGGATRKVADTMSRPGQNFVSGFRDAQAANSSFTGFLGSTGGRVRDLADTMIRPGNNFVQGFRSASAAQSSFTGVMGTFGGAVRTTYDTASGHITGFKNRVGAAWKEIQDGSGPAGKEAGTRFGTGLTDALKVTLAGAGVAGIATGFMNAVTKAGDLEQSIGAVDAVFKQSSGVMHGYAQDAATTVGISQNAYNEFASRLGASLKNAGTPMDELAGKTNDLITMGADLSSMYGGTTAEAVDALSAALRGEMDPIERYGISLNDAALTAEGLSMGIKKADGAFTNQQKQLIVMSLLQKQSADATGNFNREQDTYAHKVQVAKARLEDLTTATGQRFLPVMTDLMGWILDKGIPAFEEFGGGITAFGAAWNAFDGDITSSGFPGFMEAAAFNIRSVYEAVVGSMDYWGPFALGIGAVAGALGLAVGAMTLFNSVQAAALGVKTTWLILTGAQEGALWGLTAAQTAALWPITLMVVGIGLLVGALILAYNKVGWFRDMVDTAWAWIQQTTASLVSWWTTVAWPAILNGLQWIGDKFVWLWQNVAVPAWGFIQSAISSFIDWWTGTAWPAITMAAQWIGDKFVWLYQSVIVPVWDWITSTIGGFIGWWTGTFVPGVQAAADTLGSIFNWIYTGIIQPVFTAILVVVTMFAAALMTLWQGISWVVQNLVAPVFTWLYENAIRPVFDWAQARIQGFVLWFQTVAVPWVSTALESVKLAFQWMWDKVNAVFSWVSTRIQGFLDWFNSVALPFVQLVLNNIKLEFQWLADKVTAVWNWISGKISSTWYWVRDNIGYPMGVFLRDNVGGAFQWLADKVTNVWNWISGKINSAWSWARDVVLAPASGWLKNTFGPVWDWLRDKVGAVFDWIGSKIRNTTDWIRDHVLTPLGNFLQNNVVDFFQRTKDGIGKIWDGLKETVKAPIRFVVDTVINGGLIKNYNKLNDFWHGGDIGEISTGFARGGILPGYQAAKKDEILTPMRKGEGVLVPEAVRALGADFIHGVNGAANSAGIGGARKWMRTKGAAAGWVGGEVFTGGAPLSGPSGIWGGLQHQIAATGRLYIPRQNVLGVNTEDVAKAWMGRSAVDIRMGAGSPSVTFGTGTAGPWGFNNGSRIEINPSSPANMRLAILRHELGHALSLHHTTNSGSIMHPSIAGVRVPSGLDYGSLVRAWGAPGAGVKKYDVSDSGGGFDLMGMIGEKLTGFTDKAIEAAKSKFEDNRFVEAPIGVAKKTVEGFVDLAKKKLMSVGGFARGGIVGLDSPTVYDGGGWLKNTGKAQLVEHRKRKPDAVLSYEDWSAIHTAAQSVVDGRSGGFGDIHFTMNNDPERTAEQTVKRAAEQFIFEMEGAF